MVRRTRLVGLVKQLQVHLFGRTAGLDRVGLPYTALLVQAAHALAVETVPEWEYSAAYRRSRHAGYSSTTPRVDEPTSAAPDCPAGHATRALGRV